MGKKRAKRGIESYRKRLHGENVSLVDLPTVRTAPLGELWRQYLEVKSPGKQPPTLRGYEWITGSFAIIPTTHSHHFSAVSIVINKFLTLGGAGRFLWSI
jgi:hypothetical protein